MEKIIKEQTRVYLNKNKDYGDSFTEQLDIHGLVAFKVVAGFKVARMKQFIENGNLEHESAIDSALDLLNYAIMTKMWQDKDVTILNFVTILSKCLESQNKFITYILSPLTEMLNLTTDEYNGIISIYSELFK